jgi:uncharacterized protein
MHIQLYHFFVLPLAGFVGMLAGGYWRIGCSWLIVPVLLLMGANPMETVGIALLQMTPSILPEGIRVVRKLSWNKWGELGLTLLIPLALASAIGAFFGRTVNIILYDLFGNIAFSCLFGALMIFLGIQIMFSRTGEYGCTLPVFNTKDFFASIGFGYVAGLLSSLFGIGGGMFFRPLFASYFKVPEKETADSTCLLLLITAMAGGFFYTYTNGAFQSQMIYPALLIAVGGIFGFRCGLIIHRIVLVNGYAQHIHKSFAIVSLTVVINLVLMMTGHIVISRYLMILISVLLITYLILFAFYVKRNPKSPSGEQPGQPHELEGK